jgi:hypothetical protein
MRKPTRNKHGTLVYSKSAKFVLAFCLADAPDRLSSVFAACEFWITLSLCLGMYLRVFEGLDLMICMSKQASKKGVGGGL